MGKLKKGPVAAEASATEPGALVATQHHPLQYLPLTSIEIVSNTRSEYIEAEMEELTASIRAHGVMQSITVRPHPEKEGLYQLAAGHRRYLGSQRAGVLEIPASIRPMTDAEFLEIQILENLQRSQVHPADEAVGFYKLREHNYTDAEIGARVGKSATYVAQRAKLAMLLPYWMQNLRIGTLPVLAANLLARQSEEVQDKLMKVDKQRLGYHTYHSSPQYSAVEIQAYISREIMHQLDSAPWAKDDAELRPKAGPCTTCPKRTSAAALLFPEFDKTDCCLDPHCWDLKLAAFIDRTTQKLTETNGKPPLLVSRDYSTKRKDAIPYSNWNEVKPGTKGAVEVLVVEGSDAGQLKTVTFSGSSAKALNDPAAVAKEKAARREENRQQRIGSASKMLQAQAIQQHIAASGQLPDQVLNKYLRGEIIRYGGPHRDMRAWLVEHFAFTMPESGTVKMADKEVEAWVNENIQRMTFPERLGMYFAFLTYNASWQLEDFAIACGADKERVRQRATALVDAPKISIGDMPEDVVNDILDTQFSATA